MERARTFEEIAMNADRTTLLGSPRRPEGPGQITVFINLGLTAYLAKLAIRADRLLRIMLDRVTSHRSSGADFDRVFKEVQDAAAHLETILEMHAQVAGINLAPASERVARRNSRENKVLGIAADVQPRRESA